MKTIIILAFLFFPFILTAQDFEISFELENNLDILRKIELYVDDSRNYNNVDRFVEAKENRYKINLSYTLTDKSILTKAPNLYLKLFKSINFSSDSTKEEFVLLPIYFDTEKSKINLGNIDVDSALMNLFCYIEVSMNGSKFITINNDNCKLREIKSLSKI
jgi:hypothetical protein